ncbi:MAG: hypothetical protein KY393_01230 [Actinobacteria bacterium]|nr:hypothetical protein [Actinomycetota bacterium]
MSDSEKTPPDSSAVEEALNHIPGLADQVGSGSESKSESDKEGTDSESDKEGTDKEGIDEAGEEQQPQGVAPEEREPVEDSDAVQAALNEIPGLKDNTDGQQN